MTFTLTEEQNAIVEFAKNNRENLSVVARAGAAKTTTLVEIAKALEPSKETILCLAFNKSIATEMAERLPKNCTAKTLHSIGFVAWRNFIKKKTRLDERKIFRLTKEVISSLATPDEIEEAYETMAEIMNIVRKGKSVGWVPDIYSGYWKPLYDNDEFYSILDIEPTELEKDVAETVSILSLKEGQEGILDFDDMVLLSAIAPVTFERFDTILVDEAQDLSPLNHHMLTKIKKSARLIIVGDPLQAIYGFRGADTQSMHKLETKFGMQTLALTISFRCAKTIVENVHWRAPDMKPADWAEEGEIKFLSAWTPDTLSFGDAIICRNNAPLFRLAIALFKARKTPQILGRDLLGPFLKIINSLGGDHVPQAIAIDNLNDWAEAKIKKSKPHRKPAIEDEKECILSVLKETKTVGDAKTYLSHLLQTPGRIYLMTGHKSKGLEYPHVYFLDSFLCDLKEIQDANLKYVIETRAKKSLTYVESAGFSFEQS